jgi:hypothetical protein
MTVLFISQHLKQQNLARGQLSCFVLLATKQCLKWVIWCLHPSFGRFMQKLHGVMQKKHSI